MAEIRKDCDNVIAILVNHQASVPVCGGVRVGQKDQ